MRELERGGPPTSRLVLWPGLGGCCSCPGLQDLMGEIETRYGLVVHCIDEGYGGVLGNIDTQIDEVCRVLKSSLDGDAGYLGFSQGGLFLRILLQRCDVLPPGPLVTLGSPHSGVTSWPSCPVTSSSWFCSIMDTVIIEDLGTTSFARSTVVPASYLYDLDASAPLLDVANSCNRTVEGGLHTLGTKVTSFAAFSFEKDGLLEPPETAWFARWDGTRVLSIDEQPELSCLRDDVHLDMAVIPGAAHMQFDEDFFFSDIMERYFSHDQATSS